MMRQPGWAVTLRTLNLDPKNRAYSPQHKRLHILTFIIEL